MHKIKHLFEISNWQLTCLGISGLVSLPCCRSKSAHSRDATSDEGLGVYLDEQADKTIPAC